MSAMHEYLSDDNASNFASRSASHSVGSRCRELLSNASQQAADAAAILDDASESREELRERVAEYAAVWRERRGTPERMLVDLKAILRAGTARMHPDVARRLSEEVIGWSIAEYYSLRSRSAGA